MNMAVYKVDYSWYQEFPCGGPGIWKKAIKLYDAETAEDLNKQIAEFLNYTECGYRKHITVENIEKL